MVVRLLRDDSTVVQSPNRDDSMVVQSPNRDESMVVQRPKRDDSMVVQRPKRDDSMVVQRPKRESSNAAGITDIFVHDCQDNVAIMSGTILQVKMHSPIIGLVNRMRGMSI